MAGPNFDNVPWFEVSHNAISHFGIHGLEVAVVVVVFAVWCLIGEAALITLVVSKFPRKCDLLL